MISYSGEGHCRGQSHPDRLWEMRRTNALVGFAATGNAAVITGHHSICWPTGAMPTGSRRGLQSPLEAQSPPDILSTYHSSGINVNNKDEHEHISNLAVREPVFVMFVITAIIVLSCVTAIIVVVIMTGPKNTIFSSH